MDPRSVGINGFRSYLSRMPAARPGIGVQLVSPQLADTIREGSMSLRLPQNLSSGLDRETGAGALDSEIMAEKAASLGRAGRHVEQALRDLKEFAGTADSRHTVLQSAADAVYGYFVQRELCGFRNHDDPIEHYAIPREVIARLGSKRGLKGEI